ncbi:MAG: crossover junction endodeoxyribonuclease RuvC [Holophagae bacterium]|jgi:crossover junction endodeoxyribonuclease RuvC
MAVRVLGVDPGSSATGWALVVVEGNRYRLEASGVIRPRGSSRSTRLADLHRRLAATVDDQRPDFAAVESSFSGINPKSGIALAESRGVVLAVLGGHQIEVSSYSPAQVKSAVVGHGRAEKEQVNYMVVRLLSLPKPPPSDAADAMAVAITHLHSRQPQIPR